jgi:hypothetical protein
VPTKAATIQAALRSRQLGQPPEVAAAYAATVRGRYSSRLAGLNHEAADRQAQTVSDLGL